MITKRHQVYLSVGKVVDKTAKFVSLQLRIDVLNDLKPIAVRSHPVTQTNIEVQKSILELV